MMPLTGVEGAAVDSPVGLGHKPRKTGVQPVIPVVLPIVCLRPFHQMLRPIPNSPVEEQA